MTHDARQRKSTHKFFAWLARVQADRALPPRDFTVAFEIGNHFNHKRGNVAWPSYLTIARKIGVSEHTVIRAVSRLRERGHLIVEPGQPGRGHPNKYRMGKGTPVHPSELDRKPAPVQVLHDRKACTRDAKTCKAVQENLLEPPMGNANAFPHGRESRSLSLAVPSGARSPVGGAPVREVKQEVTAPGDRFAELVAIWQRPWLDDEAAARKAFAAAGREAEPDAIIAAAHAWVAAADSPRFLPPLEKWLDGRGFSKPPPSRRQQRNKGKQSLAEIALRIGGHRS